MIATKNNLSPMMETKDMIYHLKNKNIKFERINEKSTFLYLKFHSNYYNITSYKNNFIKYQCGEHTGKYLDLDFAYLIDLSIIDMKLRLILFDLILDIEHYLKLKILNLIETIDLEVRKRL